MKQAKVTDRRKAASQQPPAASSRFPAASLKPPSYGIELADRRPTLPGVLQRKYASIGDQLAATSLKTVALAATQGEAPPSLKGRAPRATEPARRRGVVPPHLPRIPKPATRLSANERGRVHTVKKRAEGHASATATAPTARNNVAVAKVAVAVPQKENGALASEEVVAQLTEREPPSSANAPRFSNELVARVQMMRVSSPHDPAEHEARAIAKIIVGMEAPDEVAVPVADRAPAIARQGDGSPPVPSSVMDEIARARGAGRPLPSSVRRFMEPRFRADFGAVRVHTGDTAARLNRQLNAQAFTVGEHVFFGRDRFRPESHEGRLLIAHELTHTIQQGAAPQAREEDPVHRSPYPIVSSTTRPHVQRLGFQDVLDFIADRANLIPGFRMFTIVIGMNPVNLRSVDRSAANILRAVVEFLPGGNLITRALDAYGIFDRAGVWVEGQLATLGISGASIKAAIDGIIDSLGLRVFIDPGGAWDRAKAILGEPIGRILTFVRTLFGGILDMIKDAVLRPLAQLASKMAGWDLLCAVLGRNPITGDPVPRTAEALIGGFMNLIGQEEIWENIKRGNAVARAWAWFQGALAGALGFVRQIPTLFLNALRSLTIEDLVVLPQAFVKVGRAFGNFIGRFISWAGSTIWNLLEIIFSVVAPGVLVYLKKAAAAFKTILQNPIGFLRNLIAAGKQGFSRFVKHFVKHLKAALIGWLTGTLTGAGLYIPQGLTLLEIGKFVLSVLGITWPKIRAKIVRVIGETAMRTIETSLDIVITLVRGGTAAVWGLIKQRLADLKDIVIQSIIDFVEDRVVTAAVTKLLSLLSPAGAFIQAIIGTYNTIMFFVERLRQIAQVAAAIIDSIAAIANGAIAAAANKVEQTLAGLLTLVISFLARIAGLGKVSDAVVNLVKKVQAKVNQAIDAAINWIAQRARAFLKSLRDKEDKKDEALVERAARQAASAGWRHAKAGTGSRVHSHAEVESAARWAARGPAGVRVDVEVVGAGSSWRVKAKATKGSHTATSSSGNGWIAKSKSGQSFYAAKNLASFNRKLIDHSYRELTGGGAKGSKKPKDAERRKKEDKDKKNKETLATAARELPPRIQAALAKRPYKLVFRARLAAWRIQYKLTSLKTVPSGNQFNIEATVNPKTQLAGGYEFEDAELLAMLKRVGDRLLRENPDALARAAQRADNLEIDPSKAKAQRVYASESAEERLAIASHQKQQQPEREPRDRTLVHHGTVEDGTHVRSVHEKPGGTGNRKQGDELVRSVNEDESASNAKRYKALAKILEDRGISPQQLGEAMRLMSRGVSPPSRLKGSEKELGELMGLFFGTEPSRDSRNAVHSMIAIEQLERGGQGTTISGIFEKLPAEMKGHVKATQTLDADLAGHERPETRSRPQQERDVTELKSRQLAQLQAWFQMQIAGGRKPLSTSIQDLEVFVEDMVRRFVRSYKR